MVGPSSIARLVLLLVFAALLLQSAMAQSSEVENESVTIMSDGTRLAGNLWHPKSASNQDKLPAVLLVHGWGGTKAHLNGTYAPLFAKQGYMVLAFDYRGWGESEGKYVRIGTLPEGRSDSGTVAIEVKEIREIVDPIDQLLDIRNALAFLLGDTRVDVNRIAIWGTSLGGGLALQIAGEVPTIKVLVSQVGAVNSAANMNSPQMTQGAWRTQVDRVRSETPAFPESAIPGLRGNPDFFKFLRYDPFSFHDQVNAATLIIDAANEELFDISMNGKALHEALNGRIPVKYVALPVKHYGVYSGSGYNEATELTLAWFKEHL